MKKLLLPALFSFCALLPACEKESPQPKIETVNIEDGGDEDLIVSGLIINDAEVGKNGFCYSNSNPIPDLNDLVVETSLNGKTFSARLTNVKAGDTIWVRAFVMHNGAAYYGSALNRVVKKNPDPVIPCTLTANQVIGTNGIKYNVSSTYKTSAQYGSYSFTASCYSSGGPDLYFDFFELPKSGVYTTTNFQNWGPKKVYARYHDFYIYVFTAGKSIYVTKIADGKYKIDMCDTEFLVTGGGTPFTVPVKGNFMVDL